MRLLKAAELARGVINRLFPAHLSPWIRDLCADQRLQGAIRMRRIPEREPAFDTRVTVIRVAAAIRRHTDDPVVLELNVERATDAAVRTCRRDRALRGAVAGDGPFPKRAGRAGFDALPARDAFLLQERFVRAGHDLRREAAPLDCRRERPLHLVTRAHATRADDTERLIELEIGITGVVFALMVVRAGESITRGRHVQPLCHVLQLAVAVGRTGNAVERVVGDVELHHVAAEVCELRGLGADLHAVGNGRRAGRGIPSAALDLHETEAAGAEALEAIGGTQFGDVARGEGCGAHDRRTLGHRHRRAVDVQSHHRSRTVQGPRSGVRCTEVVIALRVHQVIPPVMRGPLWSASMKSSRKYFKALCTGYGVRPPSPHRDPWSIVSQSSSSSAIPASRLFPCRIPARISTPRVDPMRHGVHLPHDSSAQNSMAYCAISAMSTVSSKATTPP